MDIKTTTLTSINLSAADIKEIVIAHLKEKGFIVEQYTEHIDYGTEVFSGVSITANKKEETHKL